MGAPIPPPLVAVGVLSLGQHRLLAHMAAMFVQHGATVCSYVYPKSLLCGHQGPSHLEDLWPSKGNEPCLFLKTQIRRLLFSPLSAVRFNSIHSEILAWTI